MSPASVQAYRTHGTDIPVADIAIAQPQATCAFNGTSAAEGSADEIASAATRAHDPKQTQQLQHEWQENKSDARFADIWQAVTDQNNRFGTGSGTLSLLLLPPSRYAPSLSRRPEPVERSGCRVPTKHGGRCDNCLVEPFVHGVGVAISGVSKLPSK